MKARNLLLLGALASTLLVGCDLGTKELARRELRDSPPVPVVGRLFELRYTENRDVAFNSLRFVPERARRPLVLGLQSSIALVILYLLLRQRVRGRGARLALLLVLGGALGNLLERGFRGHVIDFLHLRGWPIFNLADVYITAGVALLLLTSLRRAPPPRTV